MKKIGALLLATTMLSLSLYGLYSHSYYVEMVFSLSTPFILMRDGLSLVLLAYVFLEPVRNTLSKFGLSLLGIALIALGITALGSPTLMGHTSVYVPFGDVIVFIEAGIFAIVLSAELPAKRLVFISASSLLYLSLLFTSNAADRAKQVVTLLILIGGVALVTSLLRAAAKMRTKADQQVTPPAPILITA